MIRFKKDVYYTQAYGCYLCIHIATYAILIGSGFKGWGARLELFTLGRRFRFTWPMKA